MNMESRWSKQKACFACATQCGSLSITTPMSLLANEFDVRSLLHPQVSLAAVNQIYVLQKSKDSLKACFENVNIWVWVEVRDLTIFQTIYILQCI